ncbi:MAG: hypothetical protein ABIK62_04520 [candidate division WOR-3 bacterium]
MLRSCKIAGALLCLLLLTGVMLAANPTHQTDATVIPSMIPYQGKLTDGSGVPINGTRSMVFTLYAESTAGTARWTETQSSVTVTNGLFSVILGSVTPITNVPPGPNCFLEIAVAGATLSPRVRLASAPYAYLAKQAAGVDSSAIVTFMLANSAVTTPKIADTAVTMAKIARAGATTGQVIKWNGSAWAPGKDSVGGGGGSGTVKKVMSGNAITCSPNPITDTGTVNFAYTVGNASGNVPISNGTVCTNLNADLHDGYHAGNSSGQIPINNGSQCSNLNADMLDGDHSSAFVKSVTASSPLSSTGGQNPNISLNTSGLNADMVDGYHAGNSSSQVPVSNGSLCSNLNADMLDGYHVVSAPRTPEVNRIMPLDDSKTFTILGTPNPAGNALIYSWNQGTGPGVYGQGGSSSTAYGVYGYSSYTHGVVGRCQASSGDRAGGWFSCNGGGSAQVGANIGGTSYKIYGTGNVSCIMPTREGARVMFAPEFPEPQFEDFGSGALVAGSAHVELDPLFLDCIRTDATHPLKVFVQLNDDCRGVYVTVGERGFDVHELQGGTSNARFTYRVMANRKDTGFLRYPPATMPEQAQPLDTHKATGQE